MKPTKAEYEVIGKIAKRAADMAKEFGVDYRQMDAFMDVAYCHEHCPLKLAELADADDGNFGHDVFGIRRHFNRTTLKLEDCFLPRFAKANDVKAAA